MGAQASFMNIFGIGPLEFLLILIIMLVILGPKDMVATGRKIGRFIRQVIRSPYWATIMETSKEIRDIPGKLVREAGIEEEITQIKQDTQSTLQEIQQDMQTTAQGIQNDVQTTVQEVQKDVQTSAQGIQQDLQTTAHGIQRDMKVAIDTGAPPAMDEDHKIAPQEASSSPQGAIPFAAAAPLEGANSTPDPEAPVSEPYPESTKEEGPTPDAPGWVEKPGNGRATAEMVSVNSDFIPEGHEPARPLTSSSDPPDASPEKDASSSDFTI